MKTVIRYIALCAPVIVAMTAVRCFVVEPYRITGARMGHTVKTGDCVLVNKLKQGDRRNRLLLYKSPLRRDADAAPLFVGRCIGVAGDTVLMSPDGFSVAGRRLSDMMLDEPRFRINKEIKDSLFSAMAALRIPLRDVSEDSASLALRMSMSEKELLAASLSQVVRIEIIEERPEGQTFVLPIPAKGKPATVDAFMLAVCREAIMNETGGRAVIRDGKLLVDGGEKASFTFSHDYCWIQSEDEAEGVDSRHLGLIPDNRIVGSIWFCWYGREASRRFKKIR